jgi:hypothetical protein
LQAEEREVGVGKQESWDASWSGPASPAKPSHISRDFNMAAVDWRRVIALFKTVPALEGEYVH